MGLRSGMDAGGWWVLADCGSKSMETSGLLVVNVGVAAQRLVSEWVGLVLGLFVVPSERPWSQTRKRPRTTHLCVWGLSMAIIGAFAHGNTATHWILQEHSLGSRTETCSHDSGSELGAPSDRPCRAL